MKTLKYKNTIISILMIASLILIFSTFLFFIGNDVVLAANTLENGKYEVPITNDMPMGKDNFKDTVIVEKQGDHYYMTFTVLDSTAVNNINLNIGPDIVGKSVRKNGKIQEYVFSISKQKLETNLNISGFVTGMKKDIDFNISLKLNEAVKISDTIDNPEIDRPAIYIPTLSTTISDTELEKGSYYFIPEITAKLNGNNIPVKINAYYLNQGVLEDVEIIDGKFKAEYIGEYHLIVRAESARYKTLKGNNTCNEIDVKILSKIGANSIAKIKEMNGAVPDDTTMQANYITTGEEYNLAKNAMKKIADNFEVIKVELFDTCGNIIKPTNDISFLLRANDAYNRNDIIVYRLNEDGSISEISNSNAGRYVNISTDKVGTFIVCVPGVEFVMPMWGIATITIVSIIIVIVLIIILTILIKKKKKKEQIELGTYVEKTKRTKNREKDKINKK